MAWATTVAGLHVHRLDPNTGRTVCGCTVHRLYDTRPDGDPCTVCALPQVTCPDCDHTVTVQRGRIGRHYPDGNAVTRGPLCYGAGRPAEVTR